jgi:hypothetical protein
MLTMGCTLQDPRENPTYSVIPEVLIDYDFEEEETKIWVKSAISDYKYNSITFEISMGSEFKIIEENNTYCSAVNIENNLFNLSIYVESKNREFEYNCEIEIELFENDVTITILDLDTDEVDIVNLDELPLKKVLEEL